MVVAAAVGMIVAAAGTCSMSSLVGSSSSSSSPFPALPSAVAADVVVITSFALGNGSQSSWNQQLLHIFDALGSDRFVVQHLMQ